MTLQSRKKHRITARRSARATRTSLALLLALSSAVSNSSVLAGDALRRVPQTAASASVPAATVAVARPAATGDLRPVPKFSGTSLRDPQRTAQRPAPTQQLQWRPSSQVAPPAAPAVATAAASGTSAAVRQAQFELPQPTAPQLSQPAQPTQPQATPEMGLQLPPALEAPPTSDRALPDFFADPFGERNASPPSIPDPAETDAPSSPMVLPPAETPPLQNGLRQPAEREQASPSDQPALPIPQAESAEPQGLQPAPGPGIEDVRRPRQLEDFELPGRDRGRRAPVAPEEDTTLIRPVAFSCDDFRQSIADAKIQQLSLDISPPFRPDVIEMDEFRRLKSRFEERQESRDWQSVDGRKLGRGRMRDLAYEKVIIETDFGTLEELPVNRLSEADLAYVSSQWGLPQECLIDQPQYQPRQWTASQITWKASNLMHKPLYFEEVNLERYGHTAGPFLQPVVSSAHFFANIAVLPYKMGVHSPNECQYALGYYRPGNCAPWITPPVPLSLRGALYQAAAMTGTGLLVP